MQLSLSFHLSLSLSLTGEQGAHPLFTGQRERESERERKRVRKREGEREREVELCISIVQNCFIFIFERNGRSWHLLAI
jgi:hypothetical protein